MSVEVGDIVRIAANFEFGTVDQFVNVFHLQVTVNDELDDDGFMDKVAVGVDTIYDLIAGDLSASLAFTTIEGINITQDVLLPPQDWPILTVGGSASPSLPMQIAPLVYYRTLRPRTRAAQYLPGYTEATNDQGGLLTSAALSNLQDYGNAWVSGILELTVEAGLGAYNRALDRFTPVELAIAATRFRTQRRRRRGVGS